MGYSSYDNGINAWTVDGNIWMTSLNKLINQTYNQTAPYWVSSWSWGGDPPAGGFSGTALAAQTCADTTTGALYHKGNVSTKTKHLHKLGLQMGGGGTFVPGTIMLVDRLLYYPGIDMTSSTEQTLNNSNTLLRYTDGHGIRAFLEVTTALTTGTPTFSYSSGGGSGYTGDNNGSGQAIGQTVNMVASRAVGSIPHSGNVANSNWNPFLPLAAGDAGMLSVQKVKLSAGMGAGVCSLVLCKPICTIPLLTINQYQERETIFQVPSLPRIYDGACLQFLVCLGAATATTTSSIFGDIVFGWN
jgi:hypothetical protein